MKILWSHLSIRPRLALIFGALILGMLVWSFTHFTDRKPQEELPLETRMRAFVLRVDNKYRREEYRNEISLHFDYVSPRSMQIRIHYKNVTQAGLAQSIGQAAIEHVKRLQSEDPSVAKEPLQVSLSVSKLP
jgi:uncharacterized membrane-anchored protein YhcB (DUF1043 family)